MKFLACSLALLFALPALVLAEQFDVQLRYQEEIAPDSDRYHRLTRDESWKAEQTAFIVCDVWDTHTSPNAVKRLEQFTPRLNEVLTKARAAGATIIHAPSGCMDHYKNHPARRRASGIELVENLPQDITSWCYQIPAEEEHEYPLDQSDGGSDDDPNAYKAWAKKMEAKGRNPKRPWIKQHDDVTIDEEKDFISDKGDEVWSILERNGIENVVLAGVHTNMCVLGRPFGLRRLASGGKNVVLMRDLTDTMYNPAMRPFVSHFTGTDLIVSHIERFVCPTITSAQFLGDEPFCFAGDQRQHLVMIVAEGEYETAESLPVFAKEELGHEFRVSFLFDEKDDPNSIPGMEILSEADVVLVSVRRRVLPPESMKAIRDYVAAGKPVIGIRTASHAFYIKKEPPAGYADWESFDQDVFGGNYHNHYKNDLKSTVTIADVEHPILTGIPGGTTFPQGWSLYKVMPLAEKTTALAHAEIEGYPKEPVAWTFQRKDGGKSFYTSLGNVDDFKHPVFKRLLKNGIRWAAGVEISVEEKAEQ